MNDPLAYRMTQTMRWFGPADPVRLSDLRQSGASEVVTALHEVPNGALWTREAIAARRVEIQAAGLGWTVVESLPVSDEIKRGDAACRPEAAANREHRADAERRRPGQAVDPVGRSTPCAVTSASAPGTRHRPRGSRR